MSLLDLAEHKRTEELYRSVVELAPDSTITVDIKGVITSCNAAATRILGYSKDGLVGKHFSKIRVVPFREMPKYLKLFQAAIRGVVTEPLELSFYRKDGTPVSTEVRIGLLREGNKAIGLQAVLHHHERYDGKGYPSGLANDDIPLLSRILAVGDAFSAMMTDRPYRKAFTLQETLGELQRNAGKQFDPQLAEEFIALVEKGQIE